MDDHDKTKEQLISELMELRHRVAELLAFEAECKRVKEKPSESEAMYRAIFSAYPDLIYLTDLHGNILDANTALCQRTGLSLEQVRHMNVSDLFPGLEADALANIQTRIESGEKVISFEFNAHALWGEMDTYEIHVLPLEEGGSVTKTLNLARDITWRKRVEESLRAREGNNAP
jgi:PAS domain S-box-containing protein